MISKSFVTAAVALAASSMVSGQTFTKCNPLEKSCPADPAFGSPETKCDFTQGLCKSFKSLSGTDIKTDGKGALFSIEKESNAPTIESDKYIFFGRVDIEVQAAPGKGIVTSAVLQSDDLDEIDLEWVGSDTTQVQSNYFSKGNTSSYNRGAYHPVSNPQSTFHTYSIEWTPKAVQWIIDGKTVRTLQNTGVQGADGFPQTPMQVKLGTWVAGGKDAPKGTVEWAGGYADFSQAPFNAYYKSVAITDYAGGDGPTDKTVKQYVYGDKSGNWQSIKVETGSGSSSGGDDSSSSSAASSAASSTKGSKTATQSATSSAKSDGSSAQSSTATTMATVPSSADAESATDAPSSTGASPATPTGSVPTHTGTGAAAQNVAAAGTFGLVALVAAALL